MFYAMFHGELVETKDSVEIINCEYNSLLELFHLIYGDEANLTPDNVMQLMSPSLIWGSVKERSKLTVVRFIDI